MGQPAATVGSKTSHAGKPFSPGSGSPNILIGKKPALRVLVDIHSCPLSDWFKPHFGGVVLKGSSTVFYNKMPAVRAGDRIVEFGPPNTILEGNSTVLVG
jgi:PAAR motif-containing protein